VSLVAACLVLSGCRGNDLLSVEQAGTISSSGVNSSAAANALRIGALGSLNLITASGTAGATGLANTPWVFTDLYTDVWQASDARAETTGWDLRVVPNTDADLSTIWASLHTARARASEATTALERYRPTPAWGIGQMYWVNALAEMQLAEYFCNGIPLSTAVDGHLAYGAPLSTEQVLQSAAAHLDTALTYLTGTDTTSVSLNYAARTTKARVLVGLGQFAAAATAVAGVPTSFAYLATFSTTTGDNIVWLVNTSFRRMVVGDSVSVATGGTAVHTIANAIPFAQANDPRLPVTGSTLGVSSVGKGNDTRTNVVLQRLWTGRSDAIPIVSGTDARLIEAEAALRADDIAGMMSILNTLRAAPPALSAATSLTPLPPLAQPASSDAATSLFFREKAFWTFGRGQRFGDQRRLVRQYNRSPDRVAPGGTFFKTGTSYGRDMVLEIPVNESSNPFVKAKGASYCVDKNP
jgi:hypothetical protein